MAGETDLKKMLSGLTPTLNSGEYIFICMKNIDKIQRSDTVMEFKEEEGVTIIMERQKADALKLNYNGVFGWITLEIHSSLEAVGLTAKFSNALAQNNISCNVVAGFYHDHIFVPIQDSQKAVEVLCKLSENES